MTQARRRKPASKPRTVGDGSRADAPLPVMNSDALHEPRFFLQLSATQASALQFGRVPGEVREMARLLVDETFEDLRKNAAKPVTLTRHR